MEESKQDKGHKSESERYYELYIGWYVHGLYMA